MAEQVTVKDILIDINEMLKKLSIPAELIEPVGLPVARAIKGLSICINAIAEKEKKEPEIEFVEAGAADSVPEGAEVVKTEQAE